MLKYKNIGLYVVHNALFTKYSEAPVTTLAVKDRVLADNPLRACYMADTFYKRDYFMGKSNLIVIVKTVDSIYNF
jgi:uncharacterized metal-binding protein